MAGLPGAGHDSAPGLFFGARRRAGRGWGCRRLDRREGSACARFDGVWLPPRLALGVFVAAWVLLEPRQLALQCWPLQRWGEADRLLRGQVALADVVGLIGVRRERGIQRLA